MKRPQKKKLHAIAGAIALMTLVTFWTSTMISELFLDHEAVVFVKTAILYAMTLLIPAMAAAGGTGASLTGKSKAEIPARKTKRMKFIAANGLLILAPSAVGLWWMASSGLFNPWFYGLQAVEVIAGATNITLLSLQMKDGIQLSRKKKSTPAAA